ncbi:MAG: hypothetical protein AB7P03_29860 [Kofleriaceae bacterium]
MPQVVDFPPVAHDPRASIPALVKLCKETPAGGEPFKAFRARLRAAKLWERDRPEVMLRFLGTGGAVVMPSAFMQAVAAAANEDAIAEAVVAQLWELNPLLGKTVVELVAQRAYHKDEIYKHLSSAAFRGKLPSRPALEIWLQLAIYGGLLRTLGIAVTAGPRAAHYVARAAELDVDELLAEDRPLPELGIPSFTEDEAAPSEPASFESSIPVSAGAPPGAPLPAMLRHVSGEGVANPRTRDRAVPTSRFASGFSSDVLDDTRARLASWWSDVPHRFATYRPGDFGLDAEAWVERADEVVYRIAVAAALAFRLDRERSDVIAAYESLDRAGVLGDLYQGIVPETLPAQIDARALMLASLAARRCAEAPDLASQLDGRSSAAEAFAQLDTALGRGLFKIELFWIMAMLAELGVIRYPDLGDFTVTPHRIVRDTLFRLGFIDTPYGNDGATLVAATRAARKAIPDGPADEILATFALAAGCAYDCPYRKACNVPCRERLE